MSYSLRETEVKLHTPDLAAVERALERAGAALVKPRVFERNIRYDRPDGALSADGIVLRLRQDDSAKLTYKTAGRMQDGIISRFEAEVTVSDFAVMDLILQRLGYEVALIYEKYRSSYQFGGAEIVLDELPYGNFTEIEAEAATIEAVIADLGLGACQRIGASYTDIFLALRQRLGLSARDCSFAVFAGLDVGDLFE